MPTVLKTFVRNGQRFKRGDDAPSDLDGPTAEHYRRHGMISAGTEPKAPARAPRRPHRIGQRPQLLRLFVAMVQHRRHAVLVR